ncbi:MAG: HIT domain-containing protein [Gammaproteobacteria bacterium]|nr:HIT domain-containing protein [Gammaproteobacteria bacterium]
MCVFCAIAAHVIPSKVVYEDDKFIAFLDLTQTTIGHTLVVPKRHSKCIFDLNDEDAKEIMLVVKKVANKLKASLNPIGLNVVNNNEKPLQSVDHFHIHLIPRYENDNFDIMFKDNSKEVNLDEILKKING